MNRNQTSLLIFVVSLLMFIPFLGSVHLFDWDEINFAEAAREMVLTGNYGLVQIGFEPFWEKPPLFIWMQALSMKIFGINEFAARFPNAICGALSLTFLYLIGSKWRNHQFGLMWTAVYAASLLPAFYFRSGIIDPWFNLFIFLGNEQLASATIKKATNRKVILAGLFTGLAVLTKGPAALVLVAVPALIFLTLRFKKFEFSWLHPFLFLLVVLIIGFSWFISMAVNGHWELIQEFIDYQIRLVSESEAGHGQPFYYHAIVLLLGCFPMVLFFLFGWKKVGKKWLAETDHFRLWMVILFWAVLIIFSVVKTKIIHYSSLTYLPMAFLAADWIQSVWNEKTQASNVQRILILFQATVLGSALIILSISEVWMPELLKTDLGDDVATRATLGLPINWEGWEPIVGLIMLFGGTSAIILWRTVSAKVGISVLLVSTFSTFWVAQVAFIPRVEEFTQKGVIEFYEQTSSKYERVYFEPLLHHSYAHLYYGKRPSDQHERANHEHWLLTGAVDAPVFFTIKKNRFEEFLSYHPHLIIVDDWGPFYFLTRNDEAYPFLGSR